MCRLPRAAPRVPDLGVASPKRDVAAMRQDGMPPAGDGPDRGWRGRGMGRWGFAVAELRGLLPAPRDAEAQSLTPTFPGWERYFSVSWEPFERRGQPYLRGNIVSSYGVTATRVQLLVDS